MASSSTAAAASSTSDEQAKKKAREKARLKNEKRGRAALSTEIAQKLRCPLTQKLLFDPVIADDGYTYERSAILEYLKSDKTSPVDGLTIIDATTLRSNGFIRCTTAILVKEGNLSADETRSWYAKNNQQTVKQCVSRL